MPPASLAQSRGDQAWLDELAAVRARAESLHAASRFRAACISYRE